MTGSATAAPRASRLLAVARSVVGWLLLAAGLWFVWPSTLGGCTTLTVVSGHSMEPTYYTGDLVVARCGAPRVGDVVVYHPREVGGSARIIHRIVGGDGAAGWRLKGDNNSFVDPFVPTNADVVGVARLHIPEVGRVSALLLSPWLWAGLVLVAVALLLWPSDEAADDGGGGAEPDGRSGSAAGVAARTSPDDHPEPVLVAASVPPGERP